MKKGFVILTAVLVTGCAATDTRESEREDLEYRRETERIEAREQYEVFRRNCARSGGVVTMKRYSGGRLARTPTAMEMKGASCSLPVFF